MSNRSHFRIAIGFVRRWILSEWCFIITTYCHPSLQSTQFTSFSFSYFLITISRILKYYFFSYYFNSTIEYNYLWNWFVSFLFNPNNDYHLNWWLVNDIILFYSLQKIIIIYYYRYANCKCRGCLNDGGRQKKTTMKESWIFPNGMIRMDRCHLFET